MRKSVVTMCWLITVACIAGRGHADDDCANWKINVDTQDVCEKCDGISDPVRMPTCGSITHSTVTCNNSKTHHRSRPYYDLPTAADGWYIEWATWEQMECSSWWICKHVEVEGCIDEKWQVCSWQAANTSGRCGEKPPEHDVAPQQ